MDKESKIMLRLMTKALKRLFIMTNKVYWDNAATSHCGEEFEETDCMDCSNFTQCEATLRFMNDVEKLERLQ